MTKRPKLEWYSVRCVFANRPSGGTHYVYEERITVWRAESFEAAIALAEEEAAEYTSHFTNQTDTGLVQIYWMSDKLRPGAEVFSLMRDSTLEPDEYLTRYFDTGGEHQRSDLPEASAASE